MRKNKKIRDKILNQTLKTMIIALGICIAFSVITSEGIKHFMQKNYINGYSAAAENSENTIIDQAILSAEKSSSFCSEIINSRINAILSYVEIISDCINDIYLEPANYTPKPYNNVSLCPDDYCLQWNLPENMQMSGNIEKEIYLLGNMQEQFKSLLNVQKNISSVYFTSKTGINIGYDNDAKLKSHYFDGRTTEWYGEVEKTKKPYISRPYDDSFDRGLMITAAMPCIGNNNEFNGVVGVDILINNVDEMIKNIKIGNNGYALIISPERMICSEGLTEENQTDFVFFFGKDGKSIVKQMTENESGFLEANNNGKDFYYIYNKIGLSDWTMVFAYPKEDIIKPSTELAQELDKISNDVEKKVNYQLICYIIISIIFIIGLILFVIRTVSKDADEISKPILQLCNEVKKIGKGDFDYQNCIKTNDEIEELSMSFESMTIELKAYVDNLEKLTADKQRISTELNVATQIQASALPCIFPAFPSRTDFDIYAKMTPAKEVGGDFYDFYLIGENKLGIIMADVSGKGVPAALFMMISKALIKNLALEGFKVNEILERANDRLNESNENLMFVTAFMAIIDLQTGVMRYSNAGHNPPLIKKKNGFEWLEVEKNCVLAVMPGMKFINQEIQLESGDILYTYTDGVTEAVSADGGFYGEDALINKLNGIKETDIKVICDKVREDIDSFTIGAEQSDDITMLAFKYIGSEN